MATKQQIETALKNAHNAGDTEAATKLANALISMTSTDSKAEPARPEYAAIRQGFQGASYGFGDEAVGAVGATIDTVGEFLTGEDTGDWGDKYTDIRDSERAKIKEYQENYPAESMAAEVAGGLLMPGGILKSSVSVGAKLAGGGALYGAGLSEEEEVGEVMEDALWGAGITFVGGKFINKGFESAGTMLRKAPTVDVLKTVKNAAYNRLEKAGYRYTSEHADDLLPRVWKALKSAEIGYVKSTDKQTAASVKQLENLFADGAEVSIKQLDRVRRRIHKRFDSSPDEVGILKIIDEIDNLIQHNTPGSAMLLGIARKANSRYKKAELLDDVMKQAKIQATASDGDSTYKLMKLGVANILKTPWKSKWFAPDEIKMMENFMKGTTGMNVLKTVGKLDPTGKGLLRALPLFFTANPVLAGTLSAGGFVANRAADQIGAAAGKKLVGGVSSGFTKLQPPVKPVISGMGGMMGQSEVFQNK